MRIVFVDFVDGWNRLKWRINRVLEGRSDIADGSRALPPLSTQMLLLYQLQ